MRRQDLIKEAGQSHEGLALVASWLWVKNLQLVNSKIGGTWVLIRPKMEA